MTLHSTPPPAAKARHRALAAFSSLPSPGLAALPLLLAAGCASACYEGDGTRQGLLNVEVPATWSAPEGPSPEDEVKSKVGVKPLRQAYSVEPDGTFTFSRTAEVEVGDLGVEVRELDRKHRKDLAPPAEGVRIKHVESKGPASRAGLRPEDIIVGVGDQPVRSVPNLKELVAAYPPGSMVSIDALRGDAPFEVSVELGTQKRIEASSSIERHLRVLDERQRAGLRLAELTSDVRPIVAGPDAPGEGLLVLQIVPGSSAFYSALRAGDILLRAGDVPLRTLDDFSRAIAGREPGDGVPLGVLKRGGPTETSLTISEDAMADSSLQLLIFESARKPERSKFSIFGGLIFNYRSCRAIEQSRKGVEHHTSSGWGFILNLIKYETSERGSELRLAWILPIGWSSSRTSEDS